MTESRAPGGGSKLKAKMTLRVYRVNGEGTVVEDSGTQAIQSGREPEPTMSVNPQCRCPGHRFGGAMR